MPKLAVLLDNLVDKIEKASALDGPAAAIVKTGGKLIPTGPLKDAASGTWLGHPLHPLLVSIPIGSWSASAVLDAKGQARAAQTLIGLGLIAAVPTAATGLSDWLDSDGAEQRVGLVHALANYATIGLYGASYLARRSGRSGRLLGLAGAAAMSVAGYLGGHLAYAQGVGVDTTVFEDFPTDWTDLAAAEDVSSTPMAADINGVPILLVLLDGQIRAIADRCTHRGAPLHEGAVADGCVTCPWHDSRFSLRTGAVVQGPATRPQPLFEVRQVTGRVEVRRSTEERTLRLNPTGS